MKKNFIIKRKKRLGINNITKQDVQYVNLQFCRDNEKPKSKVLTDINGKRIEWFVEPRDPHQRQLNKEADKALHILVTELELQRDKGELTWDMVIRNIEVDKAKNDKMSSWGEFCRKHCNHRQSTHLRNYISFMGRFHGAMLSSGIKDVCNSANTLILIDNMKAGINGLKGVVKPNGEKYSPVTLQHYWNTHFINVVRAFEFGLIDELPRNLKSSIPQLTEAKNLALTEQKGRYTDEELQLIKEYFIDLTNINPRVNKLTYPERQMCLRMFLFSTFYTGLRESDLKTLKWGHIKEHSDKFYILEKKMVKTKQKIIIIFDKSADFYLGERKGDDDFVFPLNDYVGYAGLHALWSSIKKKLELKNGDRKVLSFGMCRHTHAYLLIDKVKEKDIHYVQTRLGHQNIQTTLKHYTKKPKKYYEEIANKLLEHGGLDNFEK